MNPRRFSPFAVAAASLVCQATFLYAQSTRSSLQVSDSTITSLTNLSHSRREPTSLGRVDVSTDDAVDLGLSGAPGLVNSDARNADHFLTFRPLRGGTLRGAPTSARFSQSRNLPNLARSGIYSASSSRTPLSKTIVIQRTWDLQSRMMGLNAVSGEPKSLHDARDYEKASRMKTLTNNSSTTSAIQAAESPFERLTDPFSGLLNKDLERFNENLHMEQPCGDACGLGLTGQFDSFGSETHSAKRRHSHRPQAKTQVRGPDRGMF